MIKLKNLMVGYRNKPVAAPITGTFTGGSLTAIKGANGAGKSTLLKTLCGMQPAVSGEVVYEEGAQNNISFLPQHADIDSDFPINVYEVVAMGCWPRRGITRALVKDDKQRIYHALNQVGLTDLMSSSIGTLSGGQFQRMLFARMLVQDAPIMFMDEPFVGIDENTRRILLELIVALNEQGKTIVTVLHDIETVRRYFPNLLLIDQHRVLWGKTSDLLAHELDFRGREKPEPICQGECQHDLAYL